MYKKNKNTITIGLNEDINTYEGYILEVSSENIQIDGKLKMESFTVYKLYVKQSPLKQ